MSKLSWGADVAENRVSSGIIVASLGVMKGEQMSGFAGERNSSVSSSKGTSRGGAR